MSKVFSYKTGVFTDLWEYWEQRKLIGFETSLLGDRMPFSHQVLMVEEKEEKALQRTGGFTRMESLRPKRRLLM